MRSVTVLLTVLAITFSCRKKEVFPDLAKQIEGSYNVYQTSLIYTNPRRQLYDYNPKDSAQVGQVIIRKIDPLSATIRMILKKQSGEVLFDDSFQCELSRSLVNKGFIDFNALGNKGGAYHGDERIIDVGMFGTYPSKYAGMAAHFFARR